MTNKTCGENVAAHKKILIFTIVLVVLFAGVGTGLGIALSKKGNKDDSNKKDDTTPSVEPFSC